MIERNYIAKTLKLTKDLDKYLGKISKQLSSKYGLDKALAITQSAKDQYPEIIPEIPFYNTPTYDNLILLCSRMMALKKGMRDEGLGVEEFVRFNIVLLRLQSSRTPEFLRNLIGWLFLSKLARIFLKKIGRSASENGWPTHIIDGKKSDNFNMKVCTRECGMVRFFTSIGEGDLAPYCTFFDFTTSETLGIGLTQTSTIESGECSYMMSRKGKTEWPEAIQKILN